MRSISKAGIMNMNYLVLEVYGCKNVTWKEYNMVNNEPLVSFIMPVYNAEKYILDAINSIQNQTYQNWELILVEDGSTDHTLEVIQKIEHPRIILKKNKCNKGIAYSTNLGISISKGKYIALLDDDDIALPMRLEIQTDFMESHPEIDILGGKSLDIDENGKIIKYGQPPRNNPQYIKAMLLFRNVDFYNGTAMIRRKFIEKYNLSYLEGCLGMQDFKFYIESSKKGNISSVDEYVLKYRRHKENQTLKVREKLGKERALLYAKFQKQSLEDSGFYLTDQQFRLVIKAFDEFNARCDSLDELREVYDIFKVLLSQALQNKISYYKELKIFFRKKLSELLLKLELFD